MKKLKLDIPEFLINTIKNKLFLALLISLATYFLYFFPILNPQTVIYSGTDSSKYFYPTRHYLHEKLSQGDFPFWTERIFAGFPIYADIDRGILNPLNIITAVLFAPFDSYKVLHIVFYLFGSLSLYAFLQRRNLGLLEFLTSNLIYFFSFFFLYHQQHQSVILTLYSLPAVLNLADLFVKKKRFKYLIYNAILLAVLFYFGNVQGILILFMCLGVFIFTYFNFGKSILYFIFTGFLFVALILPQVFPTIMLYSQSARNIAGVSYTQGSLSPSMLVNLIFPFPYGAGDDYTGTLLSGDYIKHEMYIYVGLTAFISGVLGYVTMKKSKEKDFIKYLLILSLVLMMAGYLPILKRIDPPIISLFRYWVRASVLLVFSLAIGTAYFIKAVPKINLKSFVKDLTFPVVLVAIALFFNLREHFTLNSAKFFLSEVALLREYTLVWIVLLLIFALLLMYLFIKKHRLVVVPLVILIFVDLIYFGYFMRPNLFRQKSFFIPVNEIPVELSNSRTIFKQTYTDNYLLYTDVWGVWGYSQFEPANLKQRLELMGFESLKYYKPESLNYAQIDTPLKNIGVQYLVDTKTIYSVSESGIFADNVFQSNVHVKEEGHIIATLVSDSESTVDTYIRYYPNWELLIDGVKTPYQNNNGFISFFTNPGTYNIELNYVPYDLKFGVYSMLVMLGVLSSIMLFFKNKIYELFK